MYEFPFQLFMIYALAFRQCNKLGRVKREFSFNHLVHSPYACNLFLEIRGDFASGYDLSARINAICFGLLSQCTSVIIAAQLFCFVFYPRHCCRWYRVQFFHIERTKCARRKPTHRRSSDDLADDFSSLESRNSTPRSTCTSSDRLRY